MASVQGWVNPRGQPQEERRNYENQTCNATLQLYQPTEIWLFDIIFKNKVQLAHGCDQENTQCADNQCP